MCQWLLKVWHPAPGPKHLPYSVLHIFHPWDLRCYPKFSRTEIQFPEDMETVIPMELLQQSTPVEALVHLLAKGTSIHTLPTISGMFRLCTFCRRVGIKELDPSWPTPTPTGTRSNTLAVTNGVHKKWLGL